MLCRTNGIVHSLTACSKDWSALCQELNWTSHMHIEQQQSEQVQCIKPTARAGSHSTPSVAMDTSRLCCHNRNCNWSGAKWNSGTEPSEQVLWWQPFPAPVAVWECLQSHRPEWLQLKAPKYSIGSFPNGKLPGARGWLLESTTVVKKERWTPAHPGHPCQVLTQSQHHVTWRQTLQIRNTVSNGHSQSNDILTYAKFNRSIYLSLH